MEFEEPLKEFVRLTTSIPTVIHISIIQSILSIAKGRFFLFEELHRSIGRKFPQRRTINKGFDDLSKSDLAHLDQYEKNNKNFKLMLVVIDCFSKFV